MIIINSLTVRSVHQNTFLSPFIIIQRLMSRRLNCSSGRIIESVALLCSVVEGEEGLLLMGLHIVGNLNSEISCKLLLIKRVQTIICYICKPFEFILIECIFRFDADNWATEWNKLYTNCYTNCITNWSFIISHYLYLFKYIYMHTYNYIKNIKIKISVCVWMFFWTKCLN